MLGLIINLKKSRKSASKLKMSGGQNLMTIGLNLYSYTPFAKPFAILSPPSFLLSRSYPGIIIFRTTFAGKVV